LQHPKIEKMTNDFLSFEQMSDLYTVEQDWLFDKLLDKLNAQRHLLLTADQGWGIQEYVKELGFQLEEKYRDIRICYVDVRLAHTSASFLNLFHTTLADKFPEIKTDEEVTPGSLASLKLPNLIARRKGIRVGIFLSNAHLFHRFRDANSFLRTLKLHFRNQKKCIICLYGDCTSYYRDLVRSPGPLSGLGQLFELRHNPTRHRSASIRKLFHDHNKRIGFTTSIELSYAVDNHPIYLKLLAWHALIRTRNQCTMKTVDKALKDLILHFDHHFHKTVENLTPKQLSFLHALVEERSKPCSAATIEAYQLGSSGTVSRIRQSLANKGIIEKGSEVSTFADPVFREWLRICYFKSPDRLD
jgi:hypothetical protein